MVSFLSNAPVFFFLRISPFYFYFALTVSLALFSFFSSSHKYSLFFCPSDTAIFTMTTLFSQRRESTLILHGPRSIPTTCPRRLCNFISKWSNAKPLGNSLCRTIWGLFCSYDKTLKIGKKRFTLSSGWKTYVSITKSKRERGRERAQMMCFFFNRQWECDPFHGL